jgi:hypothetical protein
MPVSKLLKSFARKRKFSSSFPLCCCHKMFKCFLLSVKFHFTSECSANLLLVSRHRLLLSLDHLSTTNNSRARKIASEIYLNIFVLLYQLSLPTSPPSRSFAVTKMSHRGTDDLKIPFGKFSVIYVRTRKKKNQLGIIMTNLIRGGREKCFH